MRFWNLPTEKNFGTGFPSTACQVTASGSCSARLEERGLITTERTTVTTRDGRILNGCLRYTILPIQQVVEAYHQRQLAEADGMLETWKTQKRLEMYSREGGAPA